MQEIIINYFDLNNINLLLGITGIFLTGLTALGAWNQIRMRRNLYYLLNLFYIFGFLLVILTDDWFIFIIGWELVTLTTTFLLLWSSKRIAGQYFVVQFLGSSFLLFVILLAVNRGYPGIGAIDESWLQNMFIFGLGMKGAIFGLHFWLAPIHSRAPSPVSAILSGWVVKLAYITYLKLMPEGNDLLLYLGLSMIIYGGIKALLSSDYKVLLAYSSVSQLGYIALGIGSGTVYGYLGSIFHIIAHGLAKTSLFTGSGYWIKEFGARSIYKFKDGWGRQRLNSITTLIGFSSLMALPLLAGYYSKTLIKSGFNGYPLFIILLHGTSIVTILYATRFLWLGLLKDFVSGIRRGNYRLNFSDSFSLMPAGVLLLIIGLFPGVLTGFINVSLLEFDFHILEGLRDYIIYLGITIFLLIRLNWLKVKERELPSLDRLFEKIYNNIYYLSRKSRKYDPEIVVEKHLYRRFFTSSRFLYNAVHNFSIESRKYDPGVAVEKYIYRWLFNGSRFLYNIVYTGFQNQLLWLPVILLILLLWISLSGI